jgi:hypothetical protein
MHAPKTASSVDPQSRICDLPAEVVEITQEFFPGPFEVRQESDPEAPITPFVILMVHAKGDPKEIVERRLNWHRRVAGVLPDADFRLFITSV